MSIHTSHEQCYVAITMSDDTKSSLDPTAPIGVFDSGLGGLTVLRALKKRRPHERYIYLGDTARVPYGSRSLSTVRGYAHECIDYLKTCGVKAIVIACNTASAALEQELNDADWEIPVLGVLKPSATLAVECAQQKVWVLATQSTIDSQGYERHIEKLAPELETQGIACPLFVPLVEEALTQGSIPTAIAHHYLDELPIQSGDSIILGCTHYPLLANTIAAVVPPGTQIIDCGKATAFALEDILEKTNLLGPAPSRDQIQSRHLSGLEIILTDFKPSFVQTAEQFLASTVPDPKRIRVEGLSMR